MASTQTVAFLGASTGVGLAALKHTLAAGHTCIALARTPSKLTAILPAAEHPNLTILQGNAHDIDVVTRLLRKDASSIVDTIVTTIGAKPTGLGVDDPNVCAKGMATLTQALVSLRQSGHAGRPLIVGFGTTGASRFARDYPLLTTPVYKIAIKVPLADKVIMEDKLFGSGEDFTMVRASLLTSAGETNNTIRVGVEDPREGLESKAIGYTISREDAGRWIADNLILKRGEKRYLNKVATITY